ncbi:MAG: hypothetical protein OXC62_14500 [Aestuariivita sp.]|nr:hypothetical protein [Aestuariivita sp.]
MARLHRAGELTPVWVPDPEQEAMRNLTRRYQSDPPSFKAVDFRSIIMVRAEVHYDILAT